MNEKLLFTLLDNDPATLNKSVIQSELLKNWEMIKKAIILGFEYFIKDQAQAKIIETKLKNDSFSSEFKLQTILCERYAGKDFSVCLGYYLENVEEFIRFSYQNLWKDLDLFTFITLCNHYRQSSSAQPYYSFLNIMKLYAQEVLENKRDFLDIIKAINEKFKFMDVLDYTKSYFHIEGDILSFIEKICNDNQQDTLLDYTYLNYCEKGSGNTYFDKIINLTKDGDREVSIALLSHMLHRLEMDNISPIKAGLIYHKVQYESLIELARKTCCNGYLEKDFVKFLNHLLGKKVQNYTELDAWEIVYNILLKNDEELRVFQYDGHALNKNNIVDYLSSHLYNLKSNIEEIEKINQYRIWKESFGNYSSLSFFESLEMIVGKDFHDEIIDLKFYASELAEEYWLITKVNDNYYNLNSIKIDDRLKECFNIKKVTLTHSEEFLSRYKKDIFEFKECILSNYYDYVLDEKRVEQKLLPRNTEGFLLKNEPHLPIAFYNKTVSNSLPKEHIQCENELYQNFKEKLNLKLDDFEKRINLLEAIKKETIRKKIIYLVFTAIYIYCISQFYSGLELKLILCILLLIREAWSWKNIVSMNIKETISMLNKELQLINDNKGIVYYNVHQGLLGKTKQELPLSSYNQLYSLSTSIQHQYDVLENRQIGNFYSIVCYAATMINLPLFFSTSLFDLTEMEIICLVCLMAIIVWRTGLNGRNILHYLIQNLVAYTLVAATHYLLLSNEYLVNYRISSFICVFLFCYLCYEIFDKILNKKNQEY